MFSLGNDTSSKLMSSRVLRSKIILSAQYSNLESYCEYSSGSWNISNKAIQIQTLLEVTVPTDRLVRVCSKVAE